VAKLADKYLLLIRAWELLGTLDGRAYSVPKCRGSFHTARNRLLDLVAIRREVIVGMRSKSAFRSR
jgi:hypothetical protein